MPRRGLDAARVVQTAGDLADAEGIEAATLSRVAAALDVRPPSLYNHVSSHEAMVGAVAAQAMDELGAALRDAAVGRAGEDALLAVAAAYRAYAHAHPGRYALVQHGPRGDAATAAAAQAVVEVLLAVLHGYG
ncbi:MAG TPA: WHG domain-containing protein, partial [Solirubrobacteraceae bacterium]